MTANEFNEKYKDYLEEGHYGLALDNKEAIEFLDKEFQEFIKIPGFKYSQIKSKFNSFRFYANNLPEGVESRVENKLKEIHEQERNKETI